MRAQAGHRSLLATAALTYVASAAVTVTWCGSMQSMPGMPMPGGWTMSMAFMRMPGQGWSGTAATFLGMWIVMMIPMMLPAILPTLLGERKRGRLTLAFPVAYFAAWLLTGALLFPAGALLAGLAMRHADVARLAPHVAGLVLVAAGALQSGTWKVRALASCRVVDGCCAANDESSAWRAGFALGWRCVRCCAPWTAVLIVLGVMDLAAMAGVTVAITLERLLPRAECVARLAGIGVIMAGGFALLARV